MSRVLRFNHNPIYKNLFINEITASIEIDIEYESASEFYVLCSDLETYKHEKIVKKIDYFLKGISNVKIYFKCCYLNISLIADIFDRHFDKLVIKYVCLNLSEINTHEEFYPRFPKTEEVVLMPHTDDTGIDRYFPPHTEKKKRLIHFIDNLPINTKILTLSVYDLNLLKFVDFSNLPPLLEKLCFEPRYERSKSETEREDKYRKILKDLSEKLVYLTNLKTLKIGMFTFTVRL